MNGTPSDIIAIAVILCVCVAVYWAVDKLRTSKSEGAHRLRVVLGVITALLVGAFMLHDFGFGGTLMALAGVGVIVWIVRGFKNKT